MWVAPAAGGEEFDKLEQVVFKKEDVALAMRAFRAVRMTPEDVESDPLLAGHGSDVPRLLLVDAEKDVTVLGKGKLSAGNVFSAMKRVAGAFYVEKIESIVKDHIKVLNDLDKAAAEEKTLTEKKTRLEGEDKPDTKEIAKVQKDLDDLQKRLADLATRQREMWKLTPKTAS